MAERITSTDPSVHLPDQAWVPKPGETGTVIEQEGWIADDLHVSPAQRRKQRQTETTASPVVPTRKELAFSDEIFHQHYDDYLKAHAARTVWQSPYQDEQYILELSRLTAKRGARLTLEIFDRQINMPDSQHVWHVFMLGGNLPFSFGLPDITEQWVPVIDWINNSTFTARFYNDKGIQIPLSGIYYGKEYDDNLILAVKEMPEVDFQWGVEPLYVHFRNQYFWHSHLEKEGKNIRTEVLSDLVGRNGSINHHLLNIQKRKHFVDLQVNGEMRNVPEIPKEESYLQTLADNSVIDVQYHRVGDLQTYPSTLDKKNKYLLYLFDREGKHLDIAYRDDVEIFLYRYDEQMFGKKETAKEDFAAMMERHAEEYKKGNYEWFKGEVDGRYNPTVGVYYHRNQEESLRMVTHRSYGIPVDYLHRLIRAHDDRLELDKWWIKIIVRDSGLGTKLVVERNRVAYLQQLPYRDRLDAMVNTESTLLFWKARELERSDYNYIMRAYFHELSSKRILNAYGYQQAVHALANPSVSITKANPKENSYFLLPVGLADAATVFEYGDEGKLLGWYHHMGSYRYGAVHPETTYIEAFSGYGSDLIGGIENPSVLPLSRLVNKRVYRCILSDSMEVMTPWHDITKDVIPEDSSSYTEVPIPRVERDQIFVLDDSRWLCRSMSFNVGAIRRAGYLKFTLAGRHAVGKTIEPLRIPYDKVDIWINGFALVEGIDFYIQFPEVIICKGDLFEGYDPNDDETTLDVTIRAMGFVDQNMKRTEIIERGFKINNKLSIDNNYLLHQYNRRRIVEGGRVANPIVYQFNEYGETEGVFDVPVVGMRPRMMPYSIDNFAIALRGFGGNMMVYNSREEDVLREKEIVSYYTHNLDHVQKRPSQLDQMTVNHIEYPLYSPFLSAVIEKVLANPDQYLKFDYNNKTKLNRFVSQFKYLLQADPAYLGTHGEYVTIAPRVFPTETPTVVHYSILAIFEHLVKTYLQGRVDLNHWFKVVNTRETNQTTSNTGNRS